MPSEVSTASGTLALGATLLIGLAKLRLEFEAIQSKSWDITKTHTFTFTVTSSRQTKAFGFLGLLANPSNGLEYATVAHNNLGSSSSSLGGHQLGDDKFSAFIYVYLLTYLLA